MKLKPAQGVDPLAAVGTATPRCMAPHVAEDGPSGGGEPGSITRCLPGSAPPQPSAHLGALSQAARWSDHFLEPPKLKERKAAAASELAQSLNAAQRLHAEINVPATTNP